MRIPMMSRAGMVIGATVLVVSAYAAETTYGQWEAHTGIEGLGEIAKVSPTGCSNLHYSGTGSPETAQFQINVTDAHDYDRRCVMLDGEFISWQVEDAGLNQSETNWLCSQSVGVSSGSITDGSFTAVYTPGTEVEKGVTIKVQVFDGLMYNSSDPLVEKTWAGTLNTFKVGLLLKGTNEVFFWEDDANESKSIEEGLYAGLHGAVGAHVETTALGMPGAVTPDIELFTKTLVWKAVARTADQDLTVAQQMIIFSQHIDSSGIYDIDVSMGGFHIPGSSSSLLVKLFGSLTPYTAALVTVTDSLSDVCSAGSAAVGGNSVIECIAVKEVQGKLEHSHGTLPYAAADLGGLSISGGAVQLAPSSERKGSYEVKLWAGGTDYGPLAWIDVDVVPEDDASMKWGASRPYYGTIQ